MEIQLTDHGFTNLGAAEIARRIARGDCSAAEVTDAFIARIEAVNPSLNAVVVPLFSQAREAARRADERQRRGEVLGLLHGVPVTVKENFGVAGTAATMGLTARRAAIDQEDGILIQRLRRAGAIVLGKTNVPQLMIWHECDNPLFGRTNHPLDPNRTPGGSTGGEATIIAAGGSPLGIGGDLGGSIRLPAHFCGIHGLKPTSGRLPRDGVATNLRGFEAVQFQPGPLARRVEDLDLALRVLVEGEPRRAELSDVSVAPYPDRNAISIERLRVAMWTDDRFFTPSPAIRRAVTEAAARLRDCGATIVDFQPPTIDEAMRLYFRLCSADGGADARRLLAGSEVDWRVARLAKLANMPALLRGVLAAWLRFRGQKKFAQLLEFTRASSADEFWRLTFEASQYIRQFAAALDAANCDAMLCPPHALVAMPHRKAIDLFAAASYTFLPNLLGFPAGVVTTAQVQPGEESDRPASRDGVLEKAREVEVRSAGLPVAVQVIARPWREDIVLAVMAALSS